MRFYITTPIYYVSDVPHLGHAYTTTVCDALARHHRLRGHDTYFLTGTDDHGQKIARLAEAAGTTPRAFADKFADAYRSTWKALEISNDDFIRTTDEDHEHTVQQLWRAMMANGHIYEGDYEGWYCVACEQFYTEKELQPGNLCAVHSRPVDRIKEKSYFFALSKFRDKLLAHYDAHPEFILPSFRRNEVRAFVEGELRDLSISRTTFKWGIPVPEVPGHVIYVWLDALCNYYSATRRSDRAKTFWSKDATIVHMIGKEISRFHAVYWPAFLMAAGWELPTTIFCHGWWTVDGKKMSKTEGNVVDPLKLSEDLGVDAFRYFVLREVPLGADGDFSHEALITRYNAELANDLGNLVNRTLGMAHKYFGGAVMASGDNEIETAATRDEVYRHMDAYAPSMALQSLWGLIRACNAHIDRTAPWSALPERRHKILWDLLAAMDVIAGLLEPFMPERTNEMRAQLGAVIDGARRVPVPTPLFPRIDDDRKKALLEKWAPKKPAAANGPEISYDEFSKLDLRIGKVVEAEAVPKAKKLLKLQIDLGPLGRRQVVAGIAESYPPSELVGRKVIVVANLKPATIRGVESQGMILAAGEDNVVALSALDRDAPEGTKVK